MGNINGTETEVDIPVADPNANASLVVINDALKASGVISTKRAALYEIDGRIDSTAPTAIYYLQFYMAAAVPADGTVNTILLSSPIKIMHTTGLDTIVNKVWSEFGVYSPSGLSWALSSTEFTKTITSAYAIIEPFYKEVA